MAALNTDQTRGLDQTRQKLLALHTSLIALRSDLSTQNPLPSWSSMQTHANLISNNLQAIAAQLSEHQQLFTSTVVHPLPQFPSKAQEAILQTLLRTKLEPDAVEWVEQGQNMSAQGDSTSNSSLSNKDRIEFWQWAPNAANVEARKQKWGADYTLAEKQQGVENVITGLRRQLVEPPDDEGDGDEDEEDEDEYEDESEEDTEGSKMDINTQLKAASIQTAAVGTAQRAAAVKQMPLESIHKFMTTGKVG